MAAESVREEYATPVDSRYDVIVAGGGASGVIAAVAAARAGARTLLIERQGCLGGMATSGYVAQYVGFFNNETQAVWGLPYELTRRIQAAGGSNGFASYIMAEASASPIKIYNFPFNPEVVKMIADEMVEEAGVETLLHCQVVQVLKDDSRVKGLMVETVNGRFVYEAPVIVDATGDATVAARAGVAMQTDKADVEERQPTTMVFRMSNVDVKRFRAMPREQKRALALEGLAEGRLYWESMSFCSTPGGTDAICLMSRLRGFDVLDARGASEAEREGRRQVRSIVGFLNEKVPGFEDSVLAGIGARLGVRETRRIVGQYTLTEDDIVSRKAFDDVVTLGCGPLDVHDPNGTGVAVSMPDAPWDIPMRCLVPEGIEGLLVTGRGISATQEANGGSRHMATAMALGHAAGAMAAIAANGANATSSIPASSVQALLREQGAALTFEECRERMTATPA